jgi:hypothetical protein
MTITHLQSANFIHLTTLALPQGRMPPKRSDKIGSITAYVANFKLRQAENSDVTSRLGSALGLGRLP